MTIRVSLAAVVVALLVGCPFVDYFPRRALGGISPTDVIGRWKLTASAPPAAFADDGAAEFFPSGHCVLHKFAHGDEESSGTFAWSLDVDPLRNGSVLHIHFGSPEHPSTTSFYFTRKQKTLILWQYVGDPDSREYIEYERI